MKCDKCGKRIDTIEEGTKAYIPAYQVRMGHFENGCFVPDEDVGHYCSKCLSKGV